MPGKKRFTRKSTEKLSDQGILPRNRGRDFKFLMPKKLTPTQREFFNSRAKERGGIVDKAVFLVIGKLGGIDALPKYGVTFDDLRSVALTALPRAIVEGEKSNVSNFDAWNLVVMRNHLLNYMHSNSGDVMTMPFGLMSRRKNLQRIRHELAQDLGREPDFAQIGKIAGISGEEAEEILATGERRTEAHLLNIGARRTLSAPKIRLLVRRIKSAIRRTKFLTVEKWVEKKTNGKPKIERVVERLILSPEKRARLIKVFEGYLEEKSFEKIARSVGIKSRSKISDNMLMITQIVSKNPELLEEFNEIFAKL